MDVKRMKKFKDGIKEFNEMVNDLTEEDLNRKRAEGKWTVREIIHHIADAEDIWKSIIKAAVGNPGCDYDMNWYPIDNKWAPVMGYAERGVENSIELFRVSRNQIIELVEYKPDAWDNFVTAKWENLPDGKEFRVGEIVSFQILHLNRHLKQIRDSL